jgi:hypothetical protein
MGAKKKRKPDVGARRERQRVVSLHHKTRENLEALNVDVEGMFSENPVVLRRLHKASLDLREMHERMTRSNAVSPTAPTPERLRHSTGGVRAFEVNPALPKAHQVEWPLEVIRDRLSSFQYEAAERLRDAYLEMQPRSAVADTTGAGGASDPSSRLAITETMEFAGREFHWLMGRLETPFRRIVENFILERVPEGKERCMTIVEFGNRASKMGGDNQGRAAGVMAIMLACDRLNYLYHAYDSWKREQCHRTDRMMKSDIGQRAGRQGWICSLWDWCHRNGKLPQVQADVDLIRVRHDAEAVRLRNSPPMELERYHRRRDRLVSIAFRDEDERVRIVA